MESRFLVAWFVVVVLSAAAFGSEENLLPNGSFEQGMAGWMLRDGSRTQEPMGRGTIVADHACDGRAAFHYQKLVAERWYPQLWTQPVAVKPSGYYEASAMVDAREPFVFRCQLHSPAGMIDRATPCAPSEGWRRVSVRLALPEDCTAISLAFLMGNHRGAMWIDDVRLTAIAPFEEKVADASRLGPPADRIHRLDELSRRTRAKPFELLRRSDGSYPSERLVFKDTATGTELWKMSWNPGYNRHHYANIPVWNADGSKLVLSGRRDSRYGHWLVEANGSQWTCFDKPFAYWHALDPRKVYLRDPSAGTVSEMDIFSGDSRVLWKLPNRNVNLVPPSVDGKKLLAVEKEAASRTAGHSIAWLFNADGSGQPQRFDLGVDVHQLWFLKRSDYSFMFNDEKQSQRNAYQDAQWVCEPLRGGTIRVLDEPHFGHAGVSPSGQRVAHHRNGICITDIDTGKSRICASGGGGHLSWECDDRWLVATMGNQIVEVWVDEGKARRVCVPNSQLGYSTYYTEAHLESSPDGTKIGYASSMMGDCDLYVAVQRLPDPPRNMRLAGRVLTWDVPEHARELAGYCVYQGSRALNRGLVHQREFTVPEPQAKYTVTAVEHSGLQSACDDQEPPAAPTALKAAARSPYAVELSWIPPEDLDAAYYNVYVSSEGEPRPVQERRIASPTEPRMIDWGLQAAATYRYVVTAIDRAGNESKASPVAMVTTPPIQRLLQKVDVKRSLGKDPAVAEFSIPRSDTYVIWVELKPQGVSLNQSINVKLDDQRSFGWQPTWDFVCIGHGDPERVAFFDALKMDRGKAPADPRCSLKAGHHQLEFHLPAGGAELVSMTITNDQGYVPPGITSFRAERPKGRQ